VREGVLWVVAVVVVAVLVVKVAAAAAEAAKAAAVAAAVTVVTAGAMKAAMKVVPPANSGVWGVPTHRRLILLGVTLVSHSSSP
jgi:hypothetical protein